MDETKNNGIYMNKRGRHTKLFTKNLVPGKKVYGEKLFKTEGTEYREWDPSRSKLSAGILKNIPQLSLGSGDAVLYLGASSGTTVSHISDIVGRSGIVFAIDFAPRVVRDLVFVAETRKNIAPILGDCFHPDTYEDRICHCDFLFQDIAQKNQVGIFLKNMKFIGQGCQAVLSLKSRSIDVTRKPKGIYNEVLQALEKEVEVVDWKTLDPYEEDHALFLCKKR
jgi:fibrillarin-like pre-rRNA processing protein